MNNYERGLSVSYKSPTGGGRFGVERFIAISFTHHSEIIDEEI